MADRKKTANSSADSKLKQSSGFIKNPWDSLGSEPSEYKPKGVFNKFKKGKAAMLETMSLIQSTAKNLEDYGKNKLQDEAYEYGLKYLDSMIEGFEAFYDAFGPQLKQIEEGKQEIYGKYTQAPGMTVHYVAASREALDKLLERYPYTGSLLSVDSDLSKKIAEKVFEYAKKKIKPNPSRYFSTLFEEQILAHYQESANKRVAGELDQGILNAIELEADLLLDDDAKDSRMAVDHYVREVINSTRALSTPFIEKPGDLSLSVHENCAFHTSLLPAKGDESYEAKLIAEELVAKGGIADDDVDKNMIMFYQAYYGLRANSLSKFAPPRNSETYKRPGGEYFNAYSDLIKGIHPNSRLSQEITPHIDKRWHLAAKMPDLDEANQKFEEYAVNAAFFWAVVYNLFDYEKESDGTRYYELNKFALKIDDGTLLSDGKNRSSKLYEVKEGLALQPGLTSAIRNYASREEQDEIQSGVALKDAKTYDKLTIILLYLDPKEHQLDEAEKRNSNKKYISIFTLPLLLKMSMPVGNTDNDKFLEVLKVALHETVGYISGFSSPEELAGYISSYIDTQLRQFNREIKSGSFVGKEAILDPLSAQMLEVTANFLRGYGLKDKAQDVEDNADDLKKMRKEQTDR